MHIQKKPQWPSYTAFSSYNRINWGSDILYLGSHMEFQMKIEQRTQEMQSHQTFCQRQYLRKSVDVWRRNALRRGSNQCKGPEVKECLRWKERKEVRWLPHSEPGKRYRGRAWWPCKLCKTVGFYPVRDKKLSELWAEGRHYLNSFFGDTSMVWNEPSKV